MKDAESRWWFGEPPPEIAPIMDAHRTVRDAEQAVDNEAHRVNLDAMRRRSRLVVAEMMTLKPWQPPPRAWLESELRGYETDDR